MNVLLVLLLFHLIISLSSFFCYAIGVIDQPGASSIDQTVLIAVICVIVGVLLLMTSAFALYCLISFFLRRRYCFRHAPTYVLQ